MPEPDMVHLGSVCCCSEELVYCLKDWRRVQVCPLNPFEYWEIVGEPLFVAGG